MPKTFGAVLALILIVASPVLIKARGRLQSSASNDEASLTLKELDGAKRSLDDYRGKIVVLNFWATWCVPCREEMPILVALKNRYAERGVQFIAASADDEKTQKDVPRSAARLKINFPVWLGATTSDMQRLGLGDALPATAIIDRDGRIIARIIGVVDKEDLRNRLEWMLGDRSSPAPPAVVNNIEKHEHDHKDGDKHHSHGHEGEEEHEHGGVGIEGASTVPS